MTSYLRRSVAMPTVNPIDFSAANPSHKSLLWRPDSTTDPYGGYRNIRYLQDTATPWVRLWAQWPWLQPYDGTMDPATDTRQYRNGSYQGFSYNDPTRFGDMTPQRYVQHLDAQIALARSFGITVVLTFHEYPLWTNNALNDQRGRKPGARSNEWRTPLDVDSDSPWATMLRWLMTRYRGQAYFLEIMNEPNQLWWPQRNADDSEHAICVAATMMNTASNILPAYGGSPRLVGPALSDVVGGDLYQTDCLRFIGNNGSDRGMIDLMKDMGFRHDIAFAWSMHNYRDVLYDLGEHSLRNGVAGQTQAHLIRNRLVGWWRGWPRAETNDPYLLITEGGAELPKIAALYDSTDSTFIRAKQASLIERNWKRMRPSTVDGYGTSDSPGVAMVSNYLFITDTGFDSGLRDALDPNNGSAARPAYNTWKNLLPSY
jgi:hypothetical protein